MTLAASTEARSPNATQVVPFYVVSPGIFVALAVLHAGLSFGFASLPLLGVAHLSATLVAAFVVAVRSPQQVLPILAYIAGSELLWRMHAVPGPDQGGKLFSIALLATALVAGGRPKLKTTALLLAGALYLPSIALTLDEFGFTLRTRQLISFHLTGPIMIALGGATLLSMRRSIALNSILAAFAIPVAGVASWVIFSTLTAGEIRYSTQSNFATSGGFGPNQVSLILAFGAIALFILATATGGATFRFLLYAASGVLLGLSVFTFSRTGLYCAIVAITMFGSQIATTGSRRIRLVLSTLIIATIGVVFVLPRLDQTTGGALSERLADTSPGARLDLAESELELFREHPLMGVGVGVSPLLRLDPRLGFMTAHTEYTRALAEHGLLGLLAMLVIYGSWTACALGSRIRWERAVVLATGTAALLALSASAVRLAAIPLFLILAFSALQTTGGKKMRSTDETPQSLNPREHVA